MEKTAFLSDIHGNAIALEVVLKDIRNQGCKQIFVLGDIINGMDPSRCIRILKGVENLSCIKGNAEHYVLTPDLDTFPHKDEGLYPHLLPVLRWWRAHMSPADFDFIKALPDFLHQNGWYLVHDSPSDRITVQRVNLDGIDEKYREILFHGKGIPETISAEELHQILSFMDQKRVSGLFVGHTHQPFIKHLDGKMICNPGSVGFTLDGDPRPSWILCEQEDGQQSFSVRRVAYDIDQAVKRLMEVGFWEFDNGSKRDAYIKMLRTGIHWRYLI
jgi:predicted phosphodiesterase